MCILENSIINIFNEYYRIGIQQNQKIINLNKINLISNL
jgi:hypothetical protein